MNLTPATFWALAGAAAGYMTSRTKKARTMRAVVGAVAGVWAARQFNLGTPNLAARS